MELKMKMDELEERVRSFQELEPMDRARLQQDLVKLYDSLAPEVRMRNYAMIGAGAAAVLPGIGLVMGGLLGAAFASYKDADGVAAAARERLGELIQQVA